MPTPPKPPAFTPQAAPVGVEVKHVNFSRPKLKAPARLILIHTNAASGEGSIESAWNWAHAAPNSNTVPTYQVDRSGRARKMLSSDEDAIANCTTSDAEDGHGDVSEFSLAIETADTGTNADPSISDFTEAQIETISAIVAYESIVWNIPIETPVDWFGAGVAAHTDPFPFPFWTCFAGKICPGAKKKASIRNRILPRAREIRAAWTTTPTQEKLTMNEEVAAAFAAINKRLDNQAAAIAKVKAVVWDFRELQRKRQARLLREIDAMTNEAEIKAAVRAAANAFNENL